MFPLSALVLLAVAAYGANPELLRSRWSARWIAPTDGSVFEYGVYHFRRAFKLPAKPSRFVVHVTADNRYQLFVNGKRASLGPARGDLNHWRYETVDIAPYLTAGRNVLAAVVWNQGDLAPMAQNTWQTAFLLQGDTTPERIADTSANWKCFRNPAYTPIPVNSRMIGPSYYVAGPGERVDGAKYPWGWEQPGFDDAGWAKPRVLSQGSPRDSSDSPNRWMLVAPAIPAMEQTPQRIVKLRRVQGISVPGGFPARVAPFVVPANTRATLLLDQTFLTTGYPELMVSGGAGATITLRYAESLFLPGDGGKGHRDTIDGKQMLGYWDTYIAGGGSRQSFRPLWWRTWRYVEMTVQTRERPLTIDDFTGTYTGYPFERRAKFDAGSPELDRMLDVGWRTARLCAHETYMDCPYYEQLQYVGDTRIQAMVSLYMTGDDRLVRNAIEQLDSSRTPEGATYSRAPSRLQQYIPPFSLWWIGMVHDYWMYRDDPQFVRSMLPGVRQVLSFFERYQRYGGELQRVPWWNFIDWTREWQSGVPTADVDHSTAPIDLQLLLAYQWASELEGSLGLPALSSEYKAAADRLAARIRSLYWDASNRRFADNPSKQRRSQHTNSLAVLAGLATGAEAHDLMAQTAADSGAVQASIYFRYYLHRAMVKAGLGDRYLEMLDPWRKMLDNGLTTWAETADPARSDCHAWGASPNIELFRTVLGVDSAAPGFRRVRIEPHLGALKKAAGTVPHPKGEIQVALIRQGEGVQGEVALPMGVDGEFVWRGRRVALKPGRNTIAVR